MKYGTKKAKCNDALPHLYDGRYLAAGSEEGSVQIWNAQTTAMVNTRHVNVEVQALAWSPNSHVIVSSESSVVSVWQAA